jgi:hypothetical protein
VDRRFSWWSKQLRSHGDDDPDDSDGAVEFPRPGQASSYDEVSGPVDIDAK